MNRIHNQRRLPLGPRGMVRPTWRLIRDPRTALSGWAATYGDPFLLRALNGPVVVTGRPELIKQIFGGEPDQFEVFGKKTVVPVLGQGSLLVLEGQPHRRERRMLSPMFTGQQMKAYGTVMRDVALSRIAPCIGAGQFHMLRVTTEISLEIIVRAIFGGRDRDTVERMMEASRQVVRCASPLIFFSKRMQFRLGGLSPWDRFVNARQRLFDSLNEEIRRADQAADERSDILFLLRNASYEDGSRIPVEHLRESLTTLLFAGHETSALAMAWAFYHLHRNPDALAQLRHSLLADEDSPEAFARNAYLKGVVNESLRLNPIVTEVLRKPAAGMTLGQFDLPPGVAVAAAAVLTHYNPELYPDPEAFRPERFLQRNYSPFEFFPFGGGHRRCIGAAFATFEMAIVLGTLIRNFEFELLEKGPVVPRRRNVTMGPSSAIAMRVLRPVGKPAVASPTP